MLVSIVYLSKLVVIWGSSWGRGVRLHSLRLRLQRRTVPGRDAAERAGPSYQIKHTTIYYTILYYTILYHTIIHYTTSMNGINNAKSTYSIKIENNFWGWGLSVRPLPSLPGPGCKAQPYYYSVWYYSILNYILIIIGLGLQRLLLRCRVHLRRSVRADRDSGRQHTILLYYNLYH